jgi:ketosteroid isomerase-like protein
MTYLAALSIALASAAAGDARSSLDDAFRTHVRAVQARDLAALGRTITEGRELVLILPNGTRTDTRDAYLAFHRSFFADQGWTISFDILSERVVGDVGIVSTRSNYSEPANGTTSHSWVTFVFRRSGSRWLLVYDQNTRLPPPENPH